MNLCRRQLQKKIPFPSRKGSIKDATPPVPRAIELTVAAPVVQAIRPFPSMSPAPQTIPINTIINDTPAISNNASIINIAMIDNMSLQMNVKTRGKLERLMNLNHWKLIFTMQTKQTCSPLLVKNTKLLTLTTHL